MFDHDEDEDTLPSAEELIEVCHEGAHSAPHDFEDTLMVAMTQRELWLMTLAFLVLSESVPCNLSDDCAVFVERIVELMDVQKPQWRQREG